MGVDKLANKRNRKKNRSSNNKSNSSYKDLRGNNLSPNRKKRRKRRKTQLIIMISLIIVIAVLIILAIAFWGIGNKSSDNVGFREMKEGDDISRIETEVKVSEDYVEPGVGTLDESKIQGYNAQISSVNEEGVEKEENITLSDTNLKIESVGSYSGIYIEDGSDEQVTNVAAMLITNNSDQMLQIAEITFQVNDTETASFKVTDLPAGTSTLVLEANKREYSEEDSYTYGETATGYMEQPSLEEDKFDLVTEGGKITLKNKTDQSYDKVYVYYKYVQLGGAYLGGITYRTPFENVPANGEVESIAAHFNPESSKIMAVQIQQEQ